MPKQNLVYILLVTAVLIAVAMVGGKVAEQVKKDAPPHVPAEADAHAGRVLLGNQGCMSCHPVQGQGGNMGPELGAELAAKGEAWIHRYLTSGKNVDVYPGNGHAAFEEISPEQAREIARYLAALSVTAEYQGPGGIQ